MQIKCGYTVLPAILCIFLTACNEKKNQITQVARCVMATEIVAGATPGEMGIRAGQAVAEYLDESGLDVTYKEVSSIADKVRIEIVGDPELPAQVQIDRAKKIVTSEKCKSRHL